MDNEREYTLREIAQELGVSLWRIRYAMNTRRDIPRRLVGQTAVVTLANAQRALHDVDTKHSPRHSRASA